jgi:A/G-specific adenine glycosylase
MPWRDNTDPYIVLVSEIMLQQTQVYRVLPKFQEFMETYPTIKDLAKAPLGDVLKLWTGLGYNRRAKFLSEAARKVVTDFASVVPTSLENLMTLPGVGPNTAGAIMVYAYNQPAVFIETNIRTVYFHHFFTGDNQEVSDKELRELVTQTLDTENPREWYWALMDYGAYLKAQTGGYLVKSKHYVKQSPFKGSLREMRGYIIRQLSEGPLPAARLRGMIEATDDPRFAVALEALIAERMVVQLNQLLCLTDHEVTSHNR